MNKLIVMLTSTRPGRVCVPVGTWFHEFAVRHGNFDVTLVDLKEVNLPALDEPHHPMRRQYQHDHTKAWSAVVSAADAFVFVTPEYNYGLPPALVNALDHLYHEWHYKPASFVSYGGISGGLRSVQMSKQILTTLKMMPIPEAVAIPFVAKSIDEGVFKPGSTLDDSAKKMLDELHRWTEALKTLRG